MASRRPRAKRPPDHQLAEKWIRERRRTESDRIRRCLARGSGGKTAGPRRDFRGRKCAAGSNSIAVGSCALGASAGTGGGSDSRPLRQADKDRKALTGAVCLTNSL